MNEIIYALVESFKTITKWDVSKYAFATGMILMLFWAIIGYVIWPQLFSLTAYILELIPFTLIKSNGAWMLSSLIYIQVVFVTFAFIIIIFSTKIVKDSTQKKYPLYIFSIAFLVIFFWLFVWYANYSAIYNALTKLLLWLPFETIEKALSYIFAIYLLYSLFVVSLLLFVSLFSKRIIKKGIGSDIKNISKKRIVTCTLKDSIIFLAISIPLFPLLFIPVINFFVQLIVWTWLGKDTFTFDAGSLFYNKDEVNNIKQNHKKAIWTISLVASFFNFIPILNIFGPYFGEFAMYYYLEAYEDKIK